MSSKLAATDLSKDELNKLNIEKPVELKTMRTTVAKKEIHKYKNEPYSTKHIRDLGGCEKKTMNKPQEGFPGSGYMIGAINEEEEPKEEPGYEVRQDNSYLKNSSKKEAIYVPINRKTHDPGESKVVDTKLNEENRRQRRPNNMDEDSEDMQKSKMRDSSKVLPYEPKQYTDPNQHGGEHAHGLHPHECPDCHGFFCRTCGATIPPQYRPFWDEDESPEMVEFYKKRIRQERERERKLRGDCKYCDMPTPNKGQ